jgi:hypothetical protein
MFFVIISFLPLFLDYPMREIDLYYAQPYTACQTNALKESIIIEPDLYQLLAGIQVRFRLVIRSGKN